MKNNTDTNEEQRSTFWIKTTRSFPGWPSPRKDIQTDSQTNSSSSSFQNFQESVSDAWEIADDEFCNILNFKISKRVLQATAQCVINSHRNKTSSTKTQITDKPTDHLTIVSSHENLSDEINSPSHSVITDTPNIHDAEGVDPETIVSKIAKLQGLLDTELLCLEELRHLSWSGIPSEVRPTVWRLLAGYLPASLERRQTAMKRKRQEYWNFVKQYFDSEKNESYQETYRQIHIDIPRMTPVISIFQQKIVQEMFERILFIWAIRHPASGYVQGINDLVTPFFVVFLQECSSEKNIDTLEMDSITKDFLDIIEADSFWCLSKFLEGIQDNYIFAQLGIQHKVNQLKELIQRIDSALYEHLKRHGIDFLQFSFRWMNNLLTRELPLHCSIRLWDTYLAESDSFASFQLYVCAAFLLHWREELLLENDFQGLMIMLQNLPTQNWTDSDIGILVAEAYRLKYTFAGAPNHLQCIDTR